MNAYSKIESGSDVCPSCKSDDWKSAKMVVMEGTTNTAGTLDGKTTDPGRFSGGARNFLLSDRWFSWDYPIEGEIGLTTNTALVEEVKRLMVAHSANSQMPSRPNEPKMPIKPTMPIEVPKYKRTIKFAVYLALFFLIIWLGASDGFDLFSESLFLAILYTAFVAPIFIYIYRIKNKKDLLLRTEAEQAMSLYEKKLSEYEAEENKYEAEKSKYEVEKNKIMEARELLWNRARICMRCGTAYLTGD